MASRSKRALDLTAAALAVAVLLVGLAACGGGDDEGTEESTLDQATATKNLEAAGYDVAEAAPGQSALPGLVDVDFTTGADSGFAGAIQVSGNELEPFNPADVSKTGFVLFYDTAEDAAAADDAIGSGEGQRREGNALFIYGSGLDPPPPAFDGMVAAATGQ